MPTDSLTIQNDRLTELLKQAGLDSAARDVADQIQKVLIEELHHRMKNMLALVTAIVRQSMRTGTSLADAEAAITTRLLAMATAHDLLLKADLKSAGLASVIHGAVGQHNSGVGRIVVAGEEIQIIPASILPLSLVLNELCTNATKYGALSKEGGAVKVTWSRNAEDALHLRWVEQDGPAVLPPRTRSFGTRLIEEAIPRQLGGRALLAFPPTGVVFELTVPMENLRPLAPA